MPRYFHFRPRLPFMHNVFHEFHRCLKWEQTFVCLLDPDHRQGYLAHKKQTPPQDLHRDLGIILLSGPGRARFLVGEVPL